MQKNGAVCLPDRAWVLAFEAHLGRTFMTQPLGELADLLGAQNASRGFTAASEWTLDPLDVICAEGSKHHMLQRLIDVSGVRAQHMPLSAPAAYPAACAAFATLRRALCSGQASASPPVVGVTDAIL